MLKSVRVCYNGDISEGRFDKETNCLYFIGESTKVVSIRYMYPVGGSADSGKWVSNLMFTAGKEMCMMDEDLSAWEEV